MPKVKKKGLIMIGYARRSLSILTCIAMSALKVPLCLPLKNGAILEHNEIN